MTLSQEANLKSPWMTIWLSPRQTIDALLATRPRHLVWVLATLGAMASFYGLALSFGLTSQLLDWRILLGFVVASVVYGGVWLCLSALVLSWIGRLLGGRASALELRAVLAWSTVPAILGSTIVLVLLAVLRLTGGESVNGTAGFSVLLPAIVALCGVWSLIVLLLMLSRAQRFGFWRTMVSYWSSALLLAVLLAFFVRTILFQPFNLPSGSMTPTLLVGDYFFVSKYAYGYSHYSLPFSPPLFSGRIFGSEPERGDVVVFRLPKDIRTDYVKRLVGLPGDRIQMKQGLLYINDAAVARERLEDFVGPDPCGPSTAGVKRWRETLPNGKIYETLDCVDNGYYDNTKVYTVPEGHFFVLGDNRDNSTDSRVLSMVGYVPFENLIGRVELIFFSRASGPGGVAANRSERFGLMVR
jgi:signal peptidase I